MNINTNTQFTRYIGIDYSGAETPKSSLKGLRVYMAEPTVPPYEVLPPPSPRKYWTRREVAEWLVQRLSEVQPTLVGHSDIKTTLKYYITQRKEKLRKAVESVSLPDFTQGKY